MCVGGDECGGSIGCVCVCVRVSVCERVFLELRTRKRCFTFVYTVYRAHHGPRKAPMRRSRRVGHTQ